MSLRQIASKLVTLLPDDGRSVKRLYWNSVKAMRHREVSRIQKAGNWHLPPADQILWLPPERIQVHTNLRHDGQVIEPRNAVFGNDFAQNSVHGGDWDIGGIRFADLSAFKAIKERIESAKAWRDTEYFRESLKDIEAGRALWGCRTAIELDARFDYVDRLIDSVKQHGVLPQTEVTALHDASGRHSDEIEVNIGRNGEFLFQDGRHRLAIAKVLGLTRVPVKVRVRHAEWQKFREFLFSMLKASGGAAKDGLLYQSPTHPDLKDIPAEHSCEDRFEVMKSSLKVRQGRFLDIGCNLGFFCHAFEEAGLDCVGGEYGPDIAYAADRIRVSEGRNFKVVVGDILDPAIHDPILEQPVAVVNALSIFHHFLKTRENYERLQTLLQKIRPQQMYFEPHRTDESHMLHAYANLDVEEFLEFIKTNTGLKNAESIYTASDGRHIYSLTK